MTELQLRIFPPDGGVCRVEALRGGSALAVGQSRFDVAGLSDLAADPRAYGLALRDALFESESIRRAYAQAMVDGSIRLRLQLDALAGEVRRLCWERLVLPFGGEDLPAAASPQCPFSRYEALDMEDVPPLPGETVHLALVVASPRDLRQMAPVDASAEVTNLLEAWRELIVNGELRVTVLAGQSGLSVEARGLLQAVGCKVLDRAATADQLGELAATADVLHVIAHGRMTAESRAVLLLEREDGTLALADEDLLLAKLNSPRLKFAFLHSCRGSGGDAQTGLGPRLVQLGVAGVLAMQDYVPMGDARAFASAFYKTLLREGAVDVAANAGRQAILRGQSTNWSIPVLFSRLRDGQIWQSDPLRVVTRHIAADCRMDRRVQSPFPIDVTLVRGGLSSFAHGFDPSSGPRMAFCEAVRAALDETRRRESRMVLLVGSRGRAKSTLMKQFYAEVAGRFLDDSPEVPAMISCSDLVQPGAHAVRSAARAMARTCAEHGFEIDVSRLQTAIERRPFVFLVDGEAELSPSDRAEAAHLLAQLAGPGSRHCVLMTADSSQLDWTIYPESSQALVVLPMEIGRVMEYLEGQETPEVRQLAVGLRESALYDLASVPWLLASLMEDAREGARIDSRTLVLERFVREGMAQVGGPPGLRARAGEALCRIAWKMQRDRLVALSGADLYRILDEARGGREFGLEEFLAEIGKSRLLARSGDEGVRFAYSGLQSYFCARYLDQPDGQARRLEDVTATLGRLPRLKWWEDTLVLLSGMTQRPDGLLRMILAGSALTEGEQVLVAARCMHEARRAGRGWRSDNAADVVDQIVDTLMWRSQAQNVRGVVPRRQAFEALALLKEPRVTGHLFSIALDRVRMDLHGRPCFDYSGVRLAAVLALRAIPEAALQYARTELVSSGEAPLEELLSAWLGGDVPRLGRLLALGDPSISAVAAFALGTIKSQDAKQILADRYDAFTGRASDNAIEWAVTDTLALLSPMEVTGQAILPYLDKPRFAGYVAYLIGRAGIAALDGEEVAFLRRALAGGDAYVAGRALRALALVLTHQPAAQGRDDGVAHIRELCHQLVLDDRAAAAANRMLQIAAPVPQQQWAQLRLQAFEALRSVGDRTSLDVLRQVRRTSDSGDAARMRAVGSLYQLSFEVGEEIYWRLTGGLAEESYGPPREATLMRAAAGAGGQHAV